ncbi:hypothetical protein DFQ28_010191 [Apophysomyces sp. BC1034]|nr:hypothetical protein DFQ30_010642 [Apophysomyces sp. BC1015]KAG0171680.1 hypothetical protein DFQ29_008718 [Apophysomyces sp. BC1021]KAG0184959.1 hypothetical protein DFQ28_010191 [Apophysomyces sp. BC1034]
MLALKSLGVDSVLGMDFVGNTRYMYHVQEIDGAFVGHAASDLRIPTTFETLPSMKKTLAAMFSMKTFLLNTCSNIKKNVHGKHHQSVLTPIARIRDSPSPPRPCQPTPLVYFECTNQPSGRKRKSIGDETDDD